MTTAIKVLTWAGKIIGIVAALDLTAISPKYGAIIFFVSSLLKDTINRVQEFLVKQQGGM